MYFHPKMSAAVLKKAMEDYKTHRTVIPFCSPEVRDGREGGGEGGIGGGGGGEGVGGGGWRERELWGG